MNTEKRWLRIFLHLLRADYKDTSVVISTITLVKPEKSIPGQEGENQEDDFGYTWYFGEGSKALIPVLSNKKQQSNSFQ